MVSATYKSSATVCRFLSHLHGTHLLQCSAGTKRKKPDNENMDKGTVKASHLLVKHR